MKFTKVFDIAENVLWFTPSFENATVVLYLKFKYIVHKQFQICPKSIVSIPICQYYISRSRKVIISQSGPW